MKTNSPCGQNTCCFTNNLPVSITITGNFTSNPIYIDPGKSANLNISVVPENTFNLIFSGAPELKLSFSSKVAFPIVNLNKINDNTLPHWQTDENNIQNCQSFSIEFGGVKHTVSFEIKILDFNGEKIEKDTLGSGDGGGIAMVGTISTKK